MVAASAVIVPIMLSISLALRYMGTDEFVGKFALLFGMLLSTIFVPLYFLWHIADVILLEKNQKKGFSKNKANILNLTILGGITLVLLFLLSVMFSQAAVTFVEYAVTLVTLVGISFIGHKLYFKVPEDDETSERFF